MDKVDCFRIGAGLAAGIVLGSMLALLTPGCGSKEARPAAAVVEQASAVVTQ